MKRDGTARDVNLGVARSTPFVPRRVDVLGVGISAADVAATIEVVSGWIDRREREYVCAVDVNSLMHAYRDASVRAALNGAGLATADGVPLVWAARHAGCEEAGRVAGPRLMPALCEVAAERGWRVFFLGGEVGLAEAVAHAMLTRAPGLEVVGAHAPPFRELTSAEHEELISEINAARPDIVWVALGAPKQELWMAAHRGELQAAVLIGVGAAFAIHGGLVKEAPAWIQPTGFEWLYRILREPRRLTRRYLLSHPSFVRAIVSHRPFVLQSGDIGDSDVEVRSA